MGDSSVFECQTRGTTMTDIIKISCMLKPKNVGGGLNAI